MKFKIGDRVRIVGPDYLGHRYATLQLANIIHVFDSSDYAAAEYPNSTEYVVDLDELAAYFPESSLTHDYTPKEIFTLLYDEI